jgi:uncharacterized protein involved in type VI secretion and phage assembly
MAPGAGPERGIVCLPEVGDEVLVAFAEGDARLPFVLGGLFNGKDSTPVPISDLISGGEVKQRVAVSRTGHTLLFDDGKDLVRLEATGGKYQLLLDQANTTIKIGSDGKVEIQASQDVVIKAGAGMSVEATSSLELKGNGITLDAGAGNFQAKGVQATVEGSASAQLTSSGQAKIQGSIVQIN